MISPLLEKRLVTLLLYTNSIGFLFAEPSVEKTDRIESFQTVNDELTAQACFYLSINTRKVKDAEEKKIAFEILRDFIVSYFVHVTYFSLPNNKPLDKIIGMITADGFDGFEKSVFAHPFDGSAYKAIAKGTGDRRFASKDGSKVLIIDNVVAYEKIGNDFRDFLQERKEAFTERGRSKGGGP